MVEQSALMSVELMAEARVSMWVAWTAETRAGLMAAHLVHSWGDW